MEGWRFVVEHGWEAVGLLFQSVVILGLGGVFVTLIVAFYCGFVALGRGLWTFFRSKLWAEMRTGFRDGVKQYQDIRDKREAEERQKWN